MEYHVTITGTGYAGSTYTVCRILQGHDAFVRYVTQFCSHNNTVANVNVNVKVKG